MSIIPERFEEICKNKKLLYFIHVPSTGGIYLKKNVFSNDERFLWYGKYSGKKYDHHPCGLTNPVVYQGSRNHSKTYKFDPFFMSTESLSFSTVRNPFDQYVSSYLITKEQMPNLSFDDFIKITCDTEFSPSLDFGESFYLSRKFLFYQMFDDDGTCHADLVLRRERLNEGLEIIMSKIGMNANLEGSSDRPPSRWGDRREKQGFSKERDYRKFYSDESREAVEKKRNREISAFGYTFEGDDGKTVIDPRNIRYRTDIDCLEVIKK
jgi:hypothetical protein